MYYAYILKCIEGSFYVGQTDNLETTIRKHNEGGFGLTARRLPAKMVYHEQFATMAEAHERAIQFAKWRRAHKLGVDRGIITLPSDSAHHACNRTHV